MVGPKYEVAEDLLTRGTGKNIYSAEAEDSVHLFMPRIQQGIQIAIKMRALERCGGMDLHPKQLEGTGFNSI